MQLLVARDDIETAVEAICLRAVYRGGDIPCRVYRCTVALYKNQWSVYTLRVQWNDECAIGYLRYAGSFDSFNRRAEQFLVERLTVVMVKLHAKPPIRAFELVYAVSTDAFPERTRLRIAFFEPAEPLPRFIHELGM